MAQSGKRKRQRQTWHDVEIKLASHKPGTLWTENSSAQHLTHVDRKLVSSEPDAMWNDKSSAPDQAQLRTWRTVERETVSARHGTMWK